MFEGCCLGTSGDSLGLVLLFNVQVQSYRRPASHAVVYKPFVLRTRFVETTLQVNSTTICDTKNTLFTGVTPAPA